MARITGSLASVNSVPTEGTVLVRALTLRPGSTFAVTGEPKVAVIKAGRFTIEDVEPGPVQLTIQGNGVTHDVRVDVPDEDEVDFLDLLEDVYEWEPAQISAVKLAAREARKAADEAGRIASAFRGAEQLEGWAESASESAASALQSAGEAAGSAGAAAGSASEAAVSAGEAAQSKADAALSSSSADAASRAATASASSAAQSESSAATHAQSALGYAGQAEVARDESRTARDEAVLAAGRAEGVVESVSWDDDKLTVAGKTSPSLRGPKGDKGDKGEPGESGAASVRGVALNGDGEDPAAGGLESLAVGWGAKSDGDYSIAVGGGTTSGGNSSAALGYLTKATGDNSFSLGVSSRAEGEGSIIIGSASQVMGRWSTAIGTLSRVEGAGSTAIGYGHEITAPGETHIGVPESRVDNIGIQSSRVVLHGTVEATEPATKPEHLATKGDVDEVRAVAESRPAFFSGEGPPPSSIPGAVVGDYYLDETTMKLHRITGV